MAGGIHRRLRTRANRKVCTTQFFEQLEERQLFNVALSQVPALSSRPSAPIKVYLDFNGQDALKWGGYNVPTTPAYTLDSDYNSFSDAELTAIRDVWARVSEKYSPFNVDVTTVDPGNWVAGKGVHVVIGGTGTWTGSAGTGGMSYYGNFSTGSASLISWVFADNFGGGSSQIGEASAHESGHTFGLYHQSSYNGTSLVTEYYRGDSLRAPIMGNSYFAQRGLWWYGTTRTSTMMQDDLAVLASAVGYRADDHSNSTTAGDAFSYNGLSVSSSGVIERTSDIDSFTFTTGAGVVSFTGNVNSVAAMLDLKLSLYNSSGGLVANVDTGSLGETLTTTLAAGTYTLVVGSHGSYGDVGQYTVNGTIVAASAPPAVPAAPSNLAASVNGTTINLSWNDNANNETGYIVQRSTNNGASFSTAVTLGAGSRNWSDTGSAGASYIYRVYATGAGGTSPFSNNVTATIAAPTSSIPAAPVNLAVTAVTASSITFSWNDLPNETVYLIQQSPDGGKSWVAVGSTSQNVTTFTYSGLQVGKTYGLRVWAQNSAGTSPPSASVSATTSAIAAPPPPPPATSAPVAATNVRVTGVTATSMTFAWDDLSNEAVYLIQQSPDGGKSWIAVGSTAQNVTSFTNTGLQPGKTYMLRVWAQNSIGTSPPSAEVKATTALAAQGPLAAEGLLENWASKHHGWQRG